MSPIDPASTRPFSWPLFASPPIRRQSLSPETLNPPSQPISLTTFGCASQPIPSLDPRFLLFGRCAVCNQGPINRRSLRVAYPNLLMAPVPFQRFGMLPASLYNLFLWPASRCLVCFSAYLFFAPPFVPSSIKGQPSFAVSCFHPSTQPNNLSSSTSTTADNSSPLAPYSNGQEIVLISSDTESTLSEGEIVDEMSEDYATADGE
ncbi:hypothetical protein PGT21_016882 [Puccinia graminis f. sp. tritici]|uniref:Uncharacterized protein n=1 Tax=Puccinia graminis f. sp. tritici TaxID=56615 RepID=A0A5B0NQE3_PUCGR|nr:hypothetical protein PGT21_016882 [Puccinia graminis f. sp. tritici]